MVEGEREREGGTEGRGRGRGSRGELHLEVLRHEAEVEELEGDPHLPVCDDDGLPVLAQLGFDLMPLALTHRHKN